MHQKLQRFRTCRINKKCSIFHDLFEYIIFHMVVNYWTGPLTRSHITYKSIPKIGLATLAQETLRTHICTFNSYAHTFAHGHLHMHFGSCNICVRTFAHVHLRIQFCACNICACTFAHVHLRMHICA